MPEKHGWNDLEDYLHVALRVAEHHPFVVDHTLSVQPPSEAGEISGDVFCHEHIILDVSKHFEIRMRRHRKEARTVRYSYHARYENGENILRYDNAHPPQYLGYPTRHHKHDWRSGREEISHVGNDWPHLSEVLDELQESVWK
jgi:hypothetical protein